MARTVVALYDNFADANAAVRELVDHGFSRDEISMMAGDQEGRYSSYLGSSHDTVADTAAADGASVGAGLGATIGGIGGLLVGLGALVIPGIGPVIAAGPLAAALTGLAGAGAGALAGGVTGGLIGALVDSGVPEETAGYFEEGVRRGGTLVSVRSADDMSATAVDVMNRHSPVDINERSSMWRSEGNDLHARAETHHGDLHRDELGHDVQPQGTIRSTVDTGLESTEERFSDEHSIPNTGDRFGSSGSVGQTGSVSQGTVGSGGGYGYTSGSASDTSGESSYGGMYSHTGKSSPETTGGESEFGGMHDDRSASSHNTIGSSGFESNRPESSSDFGQQARSEDVNATYRSSEMPHQDTARDFTHERGDESNVFYRGSNQDMHVGRTFEEFDYYNNGFQTHFNGQYGTNYDYDAYRPAYRYGYDLAVDPRYVDRQWSDVEMDAQRYWDDREPGAWQRFKDAIRYAWDEVRRDR